MEITNYRNFLAALNEFVGSSVAEHAGVTKDTIYKMQRGVPVSLQTLEAVATSLGHRVEYRFGADRGDYSVIARAMERANCLDIEDETDLPASTTYCHRLHYFERPALKTLAKWAQYYDIEVAVV